MMMILSGAWPQATAWPAGPGGRGRRPRPGRAPARPAAAKPAPAPAGPQGQAMACARYNDGSLAAEPLVLNDILNSGNLNFEYCCCCMNYWQDTHYY